MKRAVALFAFVLALGVYAPLIARADDGAAFTSFTLNGEEADAEISSETPSVEINVSVPEEVRFTRLYICPEAADPCDGSTAIKFFSPNATTTSFTREWEGLAVSDEPVEAGVYHITVRFFRYDIQPDAFEETAPYTITVLSEDEGEGSGEQEEEDDDEELEEDDEDDGDDDEDDEDTADNPASALSALHWTPFTEDQETGDRTYGSEVVFTDGSEKAVPFNTPGEFSIETDFPTFGLEATLFYIPDPDSPTREFVASFGGFPNDSGGFSFPFDELAWSVAGVYELDIYEIEPPVLVQASLWRELFGWFVGYEAHAAEHANLIDRIRFTVFEEIASPPEPEYAECCSSVIFLPGFEGSILKSGDNTLWPPTPLDVTNDLAALRLDGSGNSVTSDVVVDGIMNTFLTSPVYEEFTAFMDTLVTVDPTTGTSTIKSWLPLAYDWRFAPERIIEDGIATSTGTIDVLETIEQFALASDTGQVTLVAHSNGGLLGKTIIKALQDAGKEELIDSFVMVGSPQLGTPQAVGGLLHGEGSQLGNWLYTSVTKAQARVLGSNMESAYNLLPSREYFTDVTDPPALFDENAGYADPWRALWGQAIGNYIELFDFLTDAESTRGVPSEDDTDSPTELNSAILNRADAFHQTYDAYTIPDSIRVVQVAGWGAETIKRIDYLATELYRPFQTPDEKPYYVVQRTIEGDGVVVYPSALSSEGERYYFNHESYGGNLKHKDLLRIDQIQNVITAIINERPVQLTEFISDIKPTATEISDRLLVAVHSPLTLGVYDSEGNFTGLDPRNDQNWGIRFVKNDIPNSSYFEYGESKYLTVPEGGSYSFVFEGTDTGTATIVLETIAADNSTTTATYSNIPVTQATLAQFTFGTGNEEPEISLDTDGDGAADATILSDEKTLELQAQEAQEAVSIETTSPSGGGGPLWNSPTPSVPPPLVLGTSTEAIAESLPVAQPPTNDVPLPELVVISPSISESIPEALIQEYENTPETPELVEQTATAVQSGWYDVLVKFVRDSFASFAAFLRQLF